MSAAEPTRSEAARAALLVLNPSGQRTRVEIGELPFLVGRHTGNNLVLRDNRVSRSHFRIFAEDGHYAIEDLNSRHGTWVNGERIARRVLHDSDRIDFGVRESFQLTFTLDSSEIFNYPWIYAVQVETWTFTDTEAARLREYLLKGGFLMVDDFHGTQDWENFMNGMRQVLPDYPVEDLQSGDEIFHTLYDIDDKMQIPGEQYVWTGRTYEKDGYQPKWRAIRDRKGRIIVAICHNMHLGDAWEWADDPNYPETFASMAFRVGLDYILYGMTH